MRKTITKIALIALVVAGTGGIAMAGSMTGDCIDCHVMHGSEIGPVGSALKYDCIQCHANSSGGGSTKIWTGASGYSAVPQVAHNDSSGNLAGGNFIYGKTSEGGSAHNVSELFGASGVLEVDKWATNDDGTYGAPPGNQNNEKHGPAFTTDGSGSEPFDKFTCAGVAGCHGTRGQAVELDNGDVGGDRVGLTAITGAHHTNTEVTKTSTGYTNASGEQHSGSTVSAGYRFIPGLYGKGNADTATRWQNASAANHNEYYGKKTAIAEGEICTACHLADNTTNPETDLTSTLKVPNNSMSGFCSTCHGNFHSSGTENGTSGAFTRHPSDYVIPNSGEYSSYTAYELTAPVARPDITSFGNTDEVRPGTDMVMCLSCHVAHGSQNTYLLRFDYTDMWAGSATAGQEGTGCLACHTTKG